MKICRICSLIIPILMLGQVLAALSVEAGPVKYVTEDHLVPRKPAIDGALRPVLKKKLFLTPADCALLLIRPPEKGESAVLVYSQGHKDFETTYSVTLTTAEKNIHMALAVAGGEVDELSKVGVNRCDAPIPRSAALALRAAWQTMLDRTKKPNVYARPALHREELEFSIITSDTKPFYAALPNKGGKSVEAFVRLGRLLAGYCTAPPPERPSLAKRIERDAKWLIKREADAVR